MNTVNGFGFNSPYYVQQLKNGTATPKTSISSVYAAQNIKTDATTFNTALNNALGFTKSAVVSQPASSATELNTSLRPGLSPIERNKIVQELWKLPSLDKLEQAMAAHGEEIHRIIEGTMAVPVGKNELAGLMAEMEKALSNGESLESVLQKQIDKHSLSTPSGSIPENVMTADVFAIDSNTGEVKWVNAKINKSASKTMEDISRDDDIVWDLAYDLQQFMRYTFFKSEDDNPEEVEQILAEIKERQATKNYDRFNEGISEEMPVENADGEEKKKEAEDPIDGFIKAIGEHQDKLYAERMEKEREVRRQGLRSQSFGQES